MKEEISVEYPSQTNSLSVIRPPPVILSAAKNLCLAPREILRCAQNDREARHGAGQSHLINPIQNELEIGVVPTRFETLGMDANARRLFLTQEIQTNVA